MNSLLQTRGLTLKFGGVVAAESIDFDLKAGERLAVIGANGAGKTTFINMVTGYIKPSAGKIMFDGVNITGMHPRQIVLQGIGRSFQLPQLFTEHTVRQSIELAVAARQGPLSMLRPMSKCVERDEIDHVLSVVGLSQRADDHCDSLPEGHRKLLDVAMALVLRPKLLIMDEPTSGVAADEKHPLMATIMNALSEQNVTAVFVEHDVDIVREYATRVAAWISGRIAADGSPETVMNDDEVRTVVLGH
ncbi:ATP-binding cassette domain-containing protein [Noviherbaspirillum sp. CPCC 100848]|uniref:ATP-binding cassette domain-containing protein n=1 Tax=Noviherbaspirillum album TaxID=3080276 RepID=A0ABU6JH75_9BURK|nr:ATP-binding cassette domain-containing protein [Noviherbaspirillum sp. CPCC 100848]MEC4722826.1 ATP-binding cassette domain-containing protein [Noviherbaspirillum sp. CPCC 100848]